MDTVLELLKLASVGLIAGLFTSVVANRDYRQRKWWELRVAAYQGAIEALSDLVYYYDKHYNAAIRDRDLPLEFKKKLELYWDQSMPKIRKAADMGAFLFSEEANSALREFMKDEDYQSYIEDVDASLDKARSCLVKLVACSKVDLRLHPSWIDRLS